MITVSILINDTPIFTRSGRNQLETDDQGRTKYVLDTGDVIWHIRDLGAVELAKKMLDTINEDMKPVKNELISLEDIPEDLYTCPSCDHISPFRAAEIIDICDNKFNDITKDYEKCFHEVKELLNHLISDYALAPKKWNTEKRLKDLKNMVSKIELNLNR